jgi:hypothetical protein
MDKKDIIFLFLFIISLLVVGSYFRISVIGYSVSTGVEGMEGAYRVPIIIYSIVILLILVIGISYFIKKYSSSKKG